MKNTIPEGTNPSSLKDALKKRVSTIPVAETEKPLLQVKGKKRAHVCKVSFIY